MSCAIDLMEDGLRWCGGPDDAGSSRVTGGQ